MISSTINALVLNLNPREREIVSRRFGFGKRNRETLASLGNQYGITRERVRQIEAEGLRKIGEEIGRDKLAEISENVLRHLNKLGGARREDLLVEDLKRDLKDSELHPWYFHFLEVTRTQPVHYFGDDDFHSFWYVDEEAVGNLKKFVGFLERLIAGRKEELIGRGRFADYLSLAAKKHGISELVGHNYILISRKFKKNPFGDYGLSQWEEIDPKTMGSKAYLVIKKLSEPLHFRRVAQEINKVKFDSKKALPQTIHNELIKDSRFVLVGRGMYGLREQGYFPGTAREVIAYILKKEGPLSPERVVSAVGKQRFLERNTILLNLQNKKHFKRLADGRYALH